jgi:hypothetical protein
VNSYYFAALHCTFFHSFQHRFAFFFCFVTTDQFWPDGFSSPRSPAKAPRLVCLFFFQFQHCFPCPYPRLASFICVHDVSISSTLIITKKKVFFSSPHLSHTLTISSEIREGKERDLFVDLTTEPRFALSKRLVIRAMAGMCCVSLNSGSVICTIHSTSCWNMSERTTVKC